MNEGGLSRDAGFSHRYTFYNGFSGHEKHSTMCKGNPIYGVTATLLIALVLPQMATPPLLKCHSKAECSPKHQDEGQLTQQTARPPAFLPCFCRPRMALLGILPSSGESSGEVSLGCRSSVCVSRCVGGGGGVVGEVGVKVGQGKTRRQHHLASSSSTPPLTSVLSRYLIMTTLVHEVGCASGTL